MEFQDNDSGYSAYYNITIDDLMRLNDSHSEHPEIVSATLQVAGSAPASEIWVKLRELGFSSPSTIISGPFQKTRAHRENDVQEILNPTTEVDVVAADVPSNYDEKRININDSFVSFANIPYEGQSALSVELKSSDSNPGDSGADTVVISNNLKITFQRTLRMPDDNRLHQLPASLGQFSLFNVEEYSERLPPSIVEKAGLFFAMWQREAMWLNFSARKGKSSNKSTDKYALRIYVGQINAVSGMPRNKKPSIISDQKSKQDYVVAPLQKWIDGICVAPGIVRQFVAMPWQKSGEEKFGGLQIEVIPRYTSGLKIWFRASNPQFIPINFHKSLDEYTTPAFNNLKVGEKLRVHPTPPTKKVPKRVSDIVADLPPLEVHFRAIYPERESRSEYIESHRKSTRTFEAKVHSCSEPLEPYGGPSSGHQLQTANIQTTDLKAMGLAAGGKLIQDIVKDSGPVQCWNMKQRRIINIHILDPKSCEQVTHVVPQPPPMDTKAYTDAGLPFYVMQEDVVNRLQEGDFEDVKSVAAMDQQ
ncbi:MAG: hypothetical protein Q9191_004236, partial [Dirinaria sp. TL-2023a]